MAKAIAVAPTIHSVRQLDCMNTMISHEERIHGFLLAVPPSLIHVVAALTVLNRDELNKKLIVEIKRLLVDAERGIQGIKEPRDRKKSPPNVTMKVVCSGRSGVPNKAKMPRRNVSTRCFHCGEMGHFKSMRPKIPKVPLPLPRGFKKRWILQGGHALIAKLRIAGYFRRPVAHHRPEVAGDQHRAVVATISQRPVVAGENQPSEAGPLRQAGRIERYIRKIFWSTYLRSDLEKSLRLETMILADCILDFAMYM